MSTTGATVEQVATKTRKTRTPKNAENITKGALKLTLKERVDLCHTLEESIKSEVETMQQAAKEAELIANGNK